MESLFSDYENLRATYYRKEDEDDMDTLDKCMSRVGDAYKALKDMMSGNAMETAYNMDGGARRYRKTKKHSRRHRRHQTRRR